MPLSMHVHGHLGSLSKGRKRNVLESMVVAIDVAHKIARFIVDIAQTTS